MCLITWHSGVSHVLVILSVRQVIQVPWLMGLETLTLLKPFDDLYHSLPVSEIS